MYMVVTPTLGELGECYRLPDLPKQPPASTGRIRCIEVTNVKVGRSDGRATVSFSDGGEMGTERRQKFIKRFIDPMRKVGLAQSVLRAINAGRHAVDIAWGNGQFRFTGTIARNRREAVGGQGSPSVILIDENAPDWANLQTIKANPDVGLFHELLHALQIQTGNAINDEEESERRVIGIGGHSKCRITENAYREARNLPRRCCWNREQL